MHVAFVLCACWSPELELDCAVDTCALAASRPAVVLESFSSAALRSDWAVDSSDSAVLSCALAASSSDLMEARSVLAEASSVLVAETLASSSVTRAFKSSAQNHRQRHASRSRNGHHLQLLYFRSWSQRVPVSEKQPPLWPSAAQSRARLRALANLLRQTSKLSHRIRVRAAT